MTIDTRPMDWVRHREVVRAAVALTAIVSLAAGVAIGWTIEHRRHAAALAMAARAQAAVVYNSHTAPTVPDAPAADAGSYRPIEIGPTQATVGTARTRPLLTPDPARFEQLAATTTDFLVTRNATDPDSAPQHRAFAFQRGGWETLSLRRDGREVTIRDLSMRVCVAELPPSRGTRCASAGWLSEFWWPVAGQ